MGLFGIEQKKGNSEKLSGKLTAYAIVESNTDGINENKHPIFSMVHNNMLVAQGNYKDQGSLKDFLISEVGGNLEEGLEEFLGKLDGLEGALDPEKLKERMKHFDDMKDFIPTPAKIVPFHSENEILVEEGDIYFVGTFKNIANANLAVNSIPIVYQALYREQEILMVRNEIETLVSQIELGESVSHIEHYMDSDINIEEKLIKKFIPEILYAAKGSGELKKSVSKLQTFFTGYRFPDDIKKIILLITESETLSSKDYKLIELYAKKINEVKCENFSEVEKIRVNIDRLISEI